MHPSGAETQSWRRGWFYVQHTQTECQRYTNTIQFVGGIEAEIPLSSSSRCQSQGDLHGSSDRYFPVSNFLFLSHQMETDVLAHTIHAYRCKIESNVPIGYVSTVAIIRTIQSSDFFMGKSTPGRGLLSTRTQKSWPPFVSSVYNQVNKRRSIINSVMGKR